MHRTGGMWAHCSKKIRWHKFEFVICTFINTNKRHVTYTTYYVLLLMTFGSLCYIQSSNFWLCSIFLIQNICSYMTLQQTVYYFFLVIYKYTHTRMRIVCSGLLHFSFEGFLKHEISIAFKEPGPQKYSTLIFQIRKNTDTNSQKNFQLARLCFSGLLHI